MNNTVDTESITLPVEEGFIKLRHGALVDLVDNDRGGRPRWAEIRLYTYADESSDESRYLIYIIGHSVLYHRSGACEKGIPLNAADFPRLLEEDFPVRAEHPDDLEPCGDCKPPEWQRVPAETEFDLEVTWYRYFKCLNGEEVLLTLRRDPRCKKCWHRPHEARACWCHCADYEEGPRSLSVPGRRLVEKARRKDAGIARAAGRTILL